MPTAGDRIREVRENLGWTQERLATDAGISKGFLSDVENNKRSISAEYVLKIANALGASLEYLLRGESGKEERDREPIQIPAELSKAASERGWSYADTLMLLEAHSSVVARRSSKSLRPPTADEWKQLYDAIKGVFP